MRFRGGVVLSAVVILAFAGSSAATTVPPFSNARGPITSLTGSAMTVQANAQIPTTCSRTAASPSVGEFKVGDVVMVACEGGVLTRIASGVIHLGPLTPIAGLADRPGTLGLPVPGPNPTHAQCAAAWNASGPPAARQAIAGLTPLGAEVAFGSASVSTRTSSEGVSGPMCIITFVLPGRGSRAATVNALWKGGKAPTWSGYVASGGVRDFLTADETAFVVSTNGTLIPR